MRKLEVSGGAEGAEGGDAGHRDKRKSMFLRRLATSARDKPDHVSDEEVSHAPATVDYTLTYADFTTPTYTTPYAAGKAKFSIAPHVLYVRLLKRKQLSESFNNIMPVRTGRWTRFKIR